MQEKHNILLEKLRNYSIGIHWCWLVGWLILLPPEVGWDIIWYESEPLPSYPDLKNCSYSFKLITTLPHLFLHVMYRVLILPAHHPACPCHPLRLHAQCIDLLACHRLRYGQLPSFGVYYDGVDPSEVHRLLYCWILSLST